MWVISSYIVFRLPSGLSRVETSQMLTAQAPADTLRYMLLGFGVIFLALGVLILSLIVRFRDLGRDLEILNEIEAGKAE